VPRGGVPLQSAAPGGPSARLPGREGQGPGGGRGGGGGPGGAGAALLVAGVEGGVVTRGVGIVGRLGYSGHSLATDPAPFSWGAGVELGRLHLDYAYRASGRGGGNSTHRFGMRWSP